MGSHIQYRRLFRQPRFPYCIVMGISSHCVKENISDVNMFTVALAKKWAYI